jgi:hypothetical protein
MNEKHTVPPVTVLALGLFLELQVTVTQRHNGAIDHDEPRYHVTPFMQRSECRWSRDWMEKMLQDGRTELDRILSDGKYRVTTTRPLPFSQVLIASSRGDQSFDEAVVGRCCGLTLEDVFLVQNPEENRVREEYKNLSHTIGINVEDMASALKAIHAIICEKGLSYLHDLLSPPLTTGNRRQELGHNIYLECMYLLHRIFHIRISIPSTYCGDYLHRMFGFVLYYAGLAPCSLMAPNEGRFYLAPQSRNFHYYKLKDFASKVLVQCHIYGPDIDIGEITRCIIHPSTTALQVRTDSIIR